MKWTTKRLQSHIRKSISSLRLKYFALSHLPQFIFVFNSGAQLSPKSLWTAFTVLYIWDDDNRIYKSSVHQTCSLSLSITNTLFRRITRILLLMGKLNSKRSYDDCCCVIFSTSKVWLPSKNAWLRFPPFALRVMEPWGCVCVFVPFPKSVSVGHFLHVSCDCDEKDLPCWSLQVKFLPFDALFGHGKRAYRHENNGKLTNFLT